MLALTVRASSEASGAWARRTRDSGERVRPQYSRAAFLNHRLGIVYARVCLNVDVNYTTIEDEALGGAPCPWRKLARFRSGSRRSRHSSSRPRLAEVPGST